MNTVLENQMIEHDEEQLNYLDKIAQLTIGADIKFDDIIKQFDHDKNLKVSGKIISSAQYIKERKFIFFSDNNPYFPLPGSHFFDICLLQNCLFVFGLSNNHISDSMHNIYDNPTVFYLILYCETLGL